MSQQYPGGWISKDPPTPSEPYESAPAPGIWTLSQALEYKVQNLWPTPGVNLPDYWLLYLQAPIGYSNFENLFVSPIKSDGSFAVGAGIGPNAGADSARGVILSFTKNAVANWGTGITTPTYNQIPATRTPQFASTGEIYFGVNNQGNTPMGLGFDKISSNGVTVTNLKQAGDTDGFLSACTLDSSDNIYITGYSPVASLRSLWVKFNSSGVYQTSDSGRDFNSRGYGTYSSINPHIDSSGNMYTWWYNIYEGGFAKINTSGVPTIATTLGGGGYASGLVDLTAERTSSPSFFYAVGYAYPNSAAWNLFKVSTSNGTTVSWSFAMTQLSPFYAKLTTDSSGNNLYVLAYDSTNNRCVLMKISSGGSIQWQRYIQRTSKTWIPVQIIYDSVSDSVFAVMYESASPAIGVVLKVPGDGSRTGTYGDVTYAASSYSTSGAAGSWVSVSIGSPSAYTNWTTPSLTAASFTPKYVRTDL